MKNMGTFHQ